jgi:guanylate kinase
VGKDAVLAEFRSAHPEIFFAVTATTRPRRPGEVDGLDYIFVTPGRFELLLALGELLEHAEVYGRHYGVPRAPLRAALAEGRDAVVKVDVQGAAYIRSIAPDAFLIFLTAPSMEELERRLTTRKTDSPEQMALRIETARDEMKQASEFDSVIVNETNAVSETVAHIVEAIEAQRNRVPPRRVAL